MTISSSRLRRAQFRWAINAPLILALCLASAASAADEPNPARAEAELKAVRSQIDKVQEEMERVNALAQDWADTGRLVLPPAESQSHKPAA